VQLAMMKSGHSLACAMPPILLHFVWEITGKAASIRNTAHTSVSYS
jgi:hypothetical protein